MTEVQAAVGRIQLKNLENMVSKRRKIAKKLSNYFKQINYFLLMS